MIRALVILWLAVAGCFAVMDDYWLVQEYFERHPEQQKRFVAFDALVRQEPVRLAKKVAQPVRIMVVYPGEQVSDYWRRSITSFTQRMDLLGIPYTLSDHFTKPDNETRKQAQLILEGLKTPTDYLVFTLDASAHKKLIEQIMVHPLPKVMLQNITTPLRAWEGRQPFLYVGFDHVVGARKLAEYYLRKSGAKGNYAVLYGPEGYVSQMRGGEFIERLRGYENLKLTQSYYVGFNRPKAKAATLDLLSRDIPLSFIYACSTDIALGAIDALKERGLLGKVMVNGWGGGSDELNAIKAGEMDVTVMRINDDNGVAMAEAIKLDLEGRAQEVPTIYTGDFALVEKGISDQQLGEYMKRAFRYSGE